ncbi:acyltransferase [Cronobacter sakazakii]|uniref:acyltransferase family protein n=1 Tax=Cronobacter sakazakii TaxID=28141 RepID=UPI001375D7CB|nr:acyltransferase [Cronobacter sakazakii]EKK7725622.1 acyltransferase [Cronobacter sakazakii]ELY5880159.1 acyltransferase [Cronobacter sakazakii]ELY5978262.1 acyltransferase [Cronobacter sakazakii]MDI7555928.1 acyltransferase [Cronobacter sakazakii]NCH34314.1 acyltransferase [Cronobacter sakazakii]
MRNELHTLQIVRGVAAMLVVTNHLLGGAFPNLWGSFFRSNGGFGVDLFFVLSGFLMVYTQHEGKSPWAFFRGRVVRIYPLYLILSLPLILMYISWNNHFEIIGNFLLLPGFNMATYKLANGPSWTLVYEMTFYILFSAALLISRKKTLSAFLVVSFIVSILIITNLVGRQPRVGIVNAGYMLGDTLMLNFAAGCLMALAHDRLCRIFKIPFWAFAVIFLITFFIVFNFIKADRIFLFGVPAMIIIMAASVTSNSGGFLFKVLHKVGDASYSIYLFHIYFGLVLHQSVITNYGHTTAVQCIAIICVLMAIISGIFISKTVEKPILQYFKK